MTFTNLIGVKHLAAALTAVTVLASASTASAASISEVTTAFNTFQADVFPGLTDNQELSVQQAGVETIDGGIEYPGFGLGTYNVDFTGTSLEMTLVADPAALGTAVYDSSTFDRYYFGFDTAIASATIDASSNPGFSAMVEIIAPGTIVDFDGVLGFTGVDPNLPTSLDMANGGILITIGEGTNLFDVDQGGTLSVQISAVPLPAGFPMLVAGIAGFGLLRRRQRAK